MWIHNSHDLKWLPVWKSDAWGDNVGCTLHFTYIHTRLTPPAKCLKIKARLMVQTYIKSCAQMIHNKSQSTCHVLAAMNKSRLHLNLKNCSAHILLMMWLQKHQSTGDKWVSIKYKTYSLVRLKVIAWN